MCPFKKAFPLVLFLHLLFAVGIFASYAQHQATHIFTLLPAVGVGEELRPGITTAVSTAPAPKVVSAPEAATATPSAPEVAPKPSLTQKISTAPATSTPSAPALSKAFPTNDTVTEISRGSVAGSTFGKTFHSGSALESSAVMGDLRPPVALKKPKPLRPANCPRGEVILQFTISELGHVTDVHVEDSPSPAMTLAVMEALPKWRFTPAKHNGQVIPLRVRQVIKF